MPTKLVLLGDSRPDQSGVPANGRQDPICRYKFLFHSSLQCQHQFETSEVFRSMMYFSDSRLSLSKLMWLADRRYQCWLSGRLLECVCVCVCVCVGGCAGARLCVAYPVKSVPQAFSSTLVMGAALRSRGLTGCHRFARIPPSPRTRVDLSQAVRPWRRSCMTCSA